MKNTFKHLLIAALFSVVLPAQAAVQTYSFSGLFDSGSYSGQTFSGSFSFDDATIDSVDLDITSLLSFDMSLLGASYTLADTSVTPDVSFQDGSLLGLSLNIDSTVSNISFAFISGSVDTSDAYIAYDTTSGLSGTGNVIYAAVPEADRYAMFLAGLGIMGVVTHRRKQQA